MNCRHHPEESDAREMLGELCRRTLERNWRTGRRDGVRYSYTAPSSGRYPWQWYWDSCFTAIAWRRLDPWRARAELESLLAAATPEGFVGHTIFWAKRVSRPRSLFYNVRSRADFMTATIQPPLLAWAWRIAVGDPAIVPQIVRHHEWIEQERAIDGDGLLWIIQPDESGLDASPKFDSTFGWCADGLPGFPLLVRRNRGLSFDISRIAAAVTACPSAAASELAARGRGSIRGDRPLPRALDGPAGQTKCSMDEASESPLPARPGGTQIWTRSERVRVLGSNPRTSGVLGVERCSASSQHARLGNGGASGPEEG